MSDENNICTSSLCSDLQFIIGELSQKYGKVQKLNDNNSVDFLVYDKNILNISYQLDQYSAYPRLIVKGVNFDYNFSGSVIKKTYLPGLITSMCKDLNNLTPECENDKVSSYSILKSSKKKIRRQKRRNSKKNKGIENFCINSNEISAKINPMIYEHWPIK